MIGKPNISQVGGMLGFFYHHKRFYSNSLLTDEND
jgi:hypothetical protein